MVTVFLKVLNMTLTASVLIVVVFVLRFFLRKAPKWISCLLWAVVAVRLLCPFSVESVLSLLPSAEPVPSDIVTEAHPEIHTGIAVLNQAVNPVLSESFAPEVGDSANPLQVYSFIAAVIWIVGILILLFYALASYLLLCRKVKASLRWKDNIKICDDIQTPFILGVFRPRIYIPSGLNEVQIEHVIAHENAHLRRLDHLWKPLGYLTLSIHWFNPFVWVAYLLLCRDIELACDEKVIQKLKKEESIVYSSSLLFCSVGRRNILICPLAFGEVGVKERISHVLHYKKPAVWIGAAAVFICAVVAVCFLTNPKRSEEDGEVIAGELLQADGLVLSKTGEVVSLTNYPELSSSDEEQDEKEKPMELEEAVIRAILMDGAVYAPSPESAPDRAASFIKLGEEVSEKSGVEWITVYGVAMYMEADFSREAWKYIQETSAYHTPVAVTVSAQGGGYQWQEYWTPRDGAYYTADVREKFPADIAEQALDTQQFVYANTMNCYAQLMPRGSGFGVIGRDLDLICMADTGDDPQTYIDHAVAEYRGMIYYGENTLSYRDKFRDDFDGIRAAILDRVCADIEEIMCTENLFPTPVWQQSQSHMAPDYSEYENLDIDYVEEDGQYIVEGDMIFQYKKVLIGRDPNAVKSLLFVVLTNDQDVTWEQVWKSMISSNSADFLPGTCVIGMKAIDD